MNIKIFPSDPNGKVNVPSSKSFAHRALIIASLAKGESHLTNFPKSNDSNVTLKGCRELGVDIEDQNSSQIKISGTDGLHIVKKGKTVRKLYCEDSGTSARLLIAMASMSPYIVEIDGSERLRKRPMGELITALRGQSIIIHGSDFSHLPLRVIGGNLWGGKITIDATDSSQYVSCLLLIAPFAQKDIIIEVTSLQSAPYIDVTIDVMKKFGVTVRQENNSFFVPREKYTGSTVAIEGDYSSASYFFALCAITGKPIKIAGLNNSSVQGDRFFLEILNKMGCRVIKEKSTIEVMGRATRAIDIDMGNYPDIVPTLSVVAATIPEKTTIRNIGHLRKKESDRLTSLSSELKKMGASVVESKDSLSISGGKLIGATIDPHNDHRIAMSLAVAAVGASTPTIIQNSQCVNKSYPAFFTDLANLHISVEEKA